MKKEIAIEKTFILGLAAPAFLTGCENVKPSRGTLVEESMMHGTLKARSPMPLIITLKRATLILLLPLLVAGCASVKPWERGTLADYTMRSDRDPLGDALAEHMYFSREAASGGRGVGGGGCGCN